MLLKFLKILTFNGNNVLSNNKQTDYLYALPNSFEKVNYIWCFNYIMQLSARRLLKPFMLSAVPEVIQDDSSISQAISDANITLASGDSIDLTLPQIRMLIIS
jgi:hypothetical protein